MNIIPDPALYYDDVVLLAQPQEHIQSRSQIPRELNRIIVAPMDAIVGEAFAREALSQGLSVCLHRFCEEERQLGVYKKLVHGFGPERIWLSVGVNSYDSRAVPAIKICERANILVDVANGYLTLVSEFVGRLTDTMAGKIMVGNIHTARGLYPYYPHVLKNTILVRIGIGNGMGCSTSDATGFNNGQITEISECSQARTNGGVQIGIVADGGIKRSGDAVKAFGAGADYVMLGGYFARAIEAEHYQLGIKKYWGGSSNFQKQREGKDIHPHQEGKVIDIQESPVPLKQLVEELWGGVASGVSYSGYRSLEDFIGNGVFRVKHKQ